MALMLRTGGWRSPSCLWRAGSGGENLEGAFLPARRRSFNDEPRLMAEIVVAEQRVQVEETLEQLGEQFTEVCGFAFGGVSLQL